MEAAAVGQVLAVVAAPADPLATAWHRSPSVDDGASSFAAVDDGTWISFDADGVNGADAVADAAMAHPCVFAAVPWHDTDPCSHSCTGNEDGVG